MADGDRSCCFNKDNRSPVFKFKNKPAVFLGLCGCFLNKPCKTGVDEKSVNSFVVGDCFGCGRGICEEFRVSELVGKCHSIGGISCGEVCVVLDGAAVDGGSVSVDDVA